MGRGIAGPALALLLAGCAGPAAPQGVGGIPPVAVSGARMAPNPLPGRLTLPAGPGPHPVVILLHGCAGISRNTEAWRTRLLDWGYGSLVLDSFQPRGVSTVCAPDRQPLVTRFDRAGDAVAAARWLQTQPGVDGARIALIGESHGGGTAATLINKPFAEAAAGQVKAVVDFYGPCRDPQLYGGVPFLALAGDADTWGDPARRCTDYGAAVAKGSPVSAITYPNAVHGFDNPRNVRLRFVEGHPMQYDPQAAADAFAHVHAFLDRTIGPGG